MLYTKQPLMVFIVVVTCIFLLVPYCDCKKSRHRDQRKSRSRRQKHSSPNTPTTPTENSDIKPMAIKDSSISKDHQEPRVSTSTLVEDFPTENMTAFQPIESTTRQDSVITQDKLSTLIPTTVETKVTSHSKKDEEGEITTATTTIVSSAPTLQQKCKIVITKQGKICGKVNKLKNGKVYSYLGIPYGEAPKGEYRFKHPRPKKAWNETKYALNYASTCHQWEDYSFESYQKGFRGTRMWNPNTAMNEDCLYLNVWTPTNPHKSKTNDLTVMVWIYGGGFYSGTSSLDVYNGQWLASMQKVVVVSMNYRIGALGFLAAGNPEIPGNAGLFDQRLALQWVQENIHSFGGDRKQVTVFGESAGAASVALHLMSEGSKGLFRNAILQSASVLSPWAVLSKEESIRRARKVAKLFDCVNTSDDTQTDKSLEFSDEMASCLRQVDPQKLVTAEMLSADWGTAGFPNAAFVDGDFLKASPYEITNETYFNNDVNILAGFNANEGNYFLVYGSPGFTLDSESAIQEDNFNKGINRTLRNLRGFKETNHYIKDVLNSLSGFTYTEGRHPSLFKKSDQPHGNKFFRTESRYSLHKDRKNQKQVTSSVDAFYRDRLDDMVGDINFVCPTIDFLHLHLQRQKKNSMKGGRKKGSYLYKFVHRSSQNPWPEWLGVMHGYEIEFVFGLPFDDKLNYTDMERNISHSMMKMWANFAKHGNPNGRRASTRELWPPYNEMSKYIYVIGDPDSDSKYSKSSLHSSKYSNQLTHCAFWREQFPKILHKIEDLPQPHTCPAVAPSKGASHSTRSLEILLLLIVWPGIFLNLF